MRPPSVDASQQLSWIRRLRAGDDSAFDEICTAYRDMLWRYVRRFLTEPDDADDVVQDVFLSLWRRRRMLEEREGFLVYLLTAARHRAFELLRHDRVVTRAEDRVTPSDIPAMGTAPTFVDDALHREHLHQVLSQFLQRVPARRREVLTMRWIDGLAYEEIAAVVGISVSAAKVQVHRSLAELRPLLERFTAD